MSKQDFSWADEASTVIASSHVAVTLGIPIQSAESDAENGFPWPISADAVKLKKSERNVDE